MCYYQKIMTSGGLCLWFWCTAVAVCFVPQAAGDRAWTARINGDVTLAGIFSVHKPRSSNGNGTILSDPRNGRVSEKGIRLVEMFFYSLDRLNENRFILPNVTLGGVVKDSWSSDEGALRSVKEIIREQGRSLEGSLTSVHNSPPLAGVIGPEPSSQTMAVQKSLNSLKRPHFSFSAKSPASTDVFSFPYMFRLQPSHLEHATALLDLLRANSWSYISLVTTGDYDGIDLRNVLLHLLNENQICIASQGMVSKDADEARFDRIVDDLSRHPAARAVVCLCDYWTVRGLLLAIQRRGRQGQFVTVGINDWMKQPFVVRDVEGAAQGALSVALSHEPVRGFNDYFRSLRPESNNRNPWFRDYWEKKFSCRLPGTPHDSIYSKPCTGDELIGTEFEESLDYVLTQKAVFAMAISLHRLHVQECGGRRDCNITALIDSPRFLDGIREALGLKNSTGSIWFDESGEPRANYSILNYQHVPWRTVRYQPVQVGTWSDHHLDIHPSRIQWPRGSTDEERVFSQSVCSYPCSRGHIRLQHKPSCCWICVPCGEGQVPVDEFTCADASTTPATRSDVLCGSQGIRVEIPVSLLSGDDITNGFALQDPTCRLSVSDGKLVADFGFSDCGTMADFTSDTIIYKNFITPLRGGDSVPVICTYPRYEDVTLPFAIAQRSVRFYEKGVGSLEMVMRQYNSSTYQTEIPASSYPIFVNSDEPVYLEVSLTNGMSNGLIAFPTKCLASESASPMANAPSRKIIKNGCEADSSVVFLLSPPGKMRFRFNAFSLSPKSRVTYVHCEMLVCRSDDRSSKCQPDCSGTAAAASGRAKRSPQAAAERSGHFVSRGPLVLDQRQTATGSSLVGVFGVVAVVGMVVAMVAVAVATITVRRRRSKFTEMN